MFCMLYFLVYLVSTIFLFTESFAKLDDLGRVSWTLVHLSGLIGSFLMSFRLLKDVIQSQPLACHPLTVVAVFFVSIWFASSIFVWAFTRITDQPLWTEFFFVAMFTSHVFFLVVFFGSMFRFLRCGEEKQSSRVSPEMIGGE